MDRGSPPNSATSWQGEVASAEIFTGRPRPGPVIGGHGWRALVTILACTIRLRGGSLAAEHPAWIAAEPILTEQCVSCHGAEKHKGGLVLTSAAGARAGGDSGPAAVAGQSDRSLLIRLVRAEDADRVMPSKGKRLTADQIRILAAWIDAGLPGPSGAEPVSAVKPERELVVRDQDRQHWAFAPWTRAQPPDIPGIPHPLDRILRRTRRRDDDLEPAAEPGLLLRRLSFTLTGLPPTPLELDAFVADRRDDAYEREVDRLLAGPGFGERWAQIWLDVARYADTAGYERDHPRPHAWPYRDWVIRAANADLPFDRFVEWQIAGDRLEPEDSDAIAATGFLVAGPQLGPISPAQLPEERANQLDDMVSTVGSAFLGLTIGCARCHDHKNEPIPQGDYYRLAACLAQVELPSRLDPRGDGVLEVVDESRPLLGAKAQRDAEAVGAESEARAEAQAARYRSAVIERRVRAEASLTEAERALLLAKVDPANSAQAEGRRRHANLLTVEAAELGVVMTPTELKAYDQARAQATAARRRANAKVWAAREGAPRATHVLERGNAAHPGSVVQPGFLTVLSSANPGADGAINADPRVALARWLTDVENGAGRTLARVIVNRVWQQHFGTGICATPNDVGTRGAEPADPELVDWLAQRLIADGWHLKRLHRLIVTAQVWRQRAGRLPDAPWRRVALRRLNAEEIRDAMLSISGALNPEPFGPAIRPWVPAEAISKINANDGWTADVTDGPATWRRSVYIHRKRVGIFPTFGIFDAAEPTTSCARRASTTTPLQALDLLNSRFVLDQARLFAARLDREVGADPARRVEWAWRWCAGRPPTSSESDRCRTLAAAQGWPAMCQVLFLSNAFLYVE